MPYRFVPAFLLASALACGAVSAKGDAPPRSDDLCASLAALAEGVMSARQAGVALAETLRITGDNEIARGMAIMAYETPRYQTPRIQQDEIARFRDLWHVQCLRG